MKLILFASYTLIVSMPPTLPFAIAHFCSHRLIFRMLGVADRAGQILVKVWSWESGTIPKGLGGSWAGLGDLPAWSRGSTARRAFVIYMAAAGGLQCHCTSPPTRDSLPTSPPCWLILTET